VTRADVTVTSSGGGVYRVEVRQGAVSTEHRVTVPAAMLDDLGLEGIDETTLVQESFAFLLEREPPTSILSQFDLPVIARYFPEYEAEIRRRLG
jgi:bifunctional DNA-binding transcriptional regulator/antitoxin component of YhaV-PrlF toxin-antitoxin module